MKFPNRITAKSLKKSGQRKALPIWNLPERTYQVQHMALSGVELIGYMADPFADIKGCEKHLEGMFMRNQLSEVHIRIFKELPKYLNRLDELEKASAAGENTEEETERTARIKALLFAISL